jgi:glutamate synthase domain-containing protein 3
MAVRIDAANMHYRELNARIREAVAAGEKKLELVHVNGQRYLADGISGEITLDIHGVPGNDLGAFMDGPTIRVHGNAQDGVGNTMNAGRIIVHGHAGDVLGYGMRGGEVFVRGPVGYRVGIHMKAFRDRRPVVIAGGVAGDFLGEYMAGGLLVVLGLGRRKGEPLVGDWCATGMHGGEIYLRGEVDPNQIATEFAALAPAQESERARIRPHLAAFAEAFDFDLENLLGDGFVRVAPVSHRPFGAKYAA